jgi:hypothetical protein
MENLKFVETVTNFTNEFIQAKETFEKEACTIEEKIAIYDACYSVIKTFAALPEKNRFYFSPNWTHNYNGREYGFKYLSFYIYELFVELANKRYEPKERNMSNVMRLAHIIRKNENVSLGIALRKSYKNIERAGKLKTNSISEECRIISDICSLGQWNDIMKNYPALNQNLQGIKDKQRPKATAVWLIADILYYITNKIGYHG